MYVLKKSRILTLYWLAVRVCHQLIVSCQLTVWSQTLPVWSPHIQHLVWSPHIQHLVWSPHFRHLVWSPHLWHHVWSCHRCLQQLHTHCLLVFYRDCPENVSLKQAAARVSCISSKVTLSWLVKLKARKVMASLWLRQNTISGGSDQQWTNRCW